MKYIRTKDGRIIDLTAYKENGLINNGIKFVNRINASFIFVQKDNILKQANTIEELCDEFVYKYVNPYHRNDKPSYELVNMTLENMKLTMEMTSGATFYGAIWTDKGLIYVAKMNEKGELELL